MSNIANFAGNTGYYQLNTQLGSQQNAHKSTGHATSLAQTLAQAAEEGANPASRQAYLLDLSPQAQQYLTSNHSVQQVIAPSTGGKPQFIVSAKQQEQLSQILVKYKDEPFTQETFNQIQDDLHEAGLSPQQLSMKDRATSFNPTQILINVLSGRGGVFGQVTGQDTEAKASNYVEQVINQWRTISTTANAQAVAPASGTEES